MPEFHDQQETARTHTPHAPQQAEQGPDHDHGMGLAATLGNARVGQVLSAPGVQRAGATSAQQLDESVARSIEQRRGRGQPLDEGVRTQMEGSLGHDLGDVRVHTDSDAHQLNEAVSARAFTTGSDVFFKQGTYEPSSSSGRELLAHELTHVVQQRTGTSGLAAGEVSHPSDSAEQHAEAVGRGVGSQSAAGPSTAAAAAPAGVAREAEEEEMQMSRDPAAAVQRQEEEEPEAG